MLMLRFIVNVIRFRNQHSVLYALSNELIWLEGLLARSVFHWWWLQLVVHLYNIKLVLKFESF